MKQYDILIVGGGGAGLYAAMEAVRTDPGLSVAVMSKIYPNRSHTSAAQGGVNAALANTATDDTVDLHIFDTVKGSDYLADQDAVEILCQDAPGIIRELENTGTPFSRLEDGSIAQRPFGGASKPRCAYCADKTGHTILQNLFEQCIRMGVNFLNEYYILRLLHDDTRASGVIAMNIRTGEIVGFQAKTIILATGGYGKMYWSRSSNAAGNTGDGQAAALRAGLSLMDMEFVQFHPTGLRKSGLLVTEGARGEGGYLINKDGERFMSRYAPEKMELGPRDLVSRSIEMEILEGRGFESSAGPYVNLDLTHLGADLIKTRLPQIRELTMYFEGVDPVEEPIPIRPTAHYSMGGINVGTDSQTPEIQGIYSAGESACVSVHGANRLGGNSLLEILVFGKRAGHAAAKQAPTLGDPAKISEAVIDEERKRLRELMSTDRYERYAPIRDEMGETLAANAGIYRKEDKLQKGLNDILELKDRFRRVRVHDTGDIFNTNLIQVLELGNMLDLAVTVAKGALLRKESRGSHSRDDYPTRDDANFHVHSVFKLKTDGDIEVSYSPVTMGKYELQERKY